MDNITQSIQSVLNSLADLLGPFGLRMATAVGILIIGWLFARIIARITRRVLGRTGLGNRLLKWIGQEEAPDPAHVDRKVARSVFWLIMLFVTIAALRAAGLTFVTDPFYELVVQIASFIPRILGAGILFLMAWIIAASVRVMVFQAGKAAGIDRRLRPEEDDGGYPMAKGIGDILFYLIVLFFLPGILGALSLDGLLGPVQAMVTTILGSLPKLFGAAMIVGVSFFVGRLCGGLVTSLLTTIGFNNILEHLGLKGGSEVAKSPSDVVGVVVFAGVLLFGVTEASQVAGFGTLAEMFSRFSVLAGNLVLALIIFALGLYLANLAANAITVKGSKQSKVSALIVRSAILALVGAMALSQTGVGSEIVALAFGLSLGAIAVAAALAFGLGGRDAAAEQIRRWNDAAKE